MNMPTETFLITLYTIVDDWYQHHAPRLLAGKTGKKPEFSDSEVMTLSLAQHWLGIDEEREFLRFIRNNHLPLFPRLVDQSQFNRRARNLCWLIHQMRQHLMRQHLMRQHLMRQHLMRQHLMRQHLMRQHLVAQMGIADTPCPPCQLIDGTPVQVRHWRRFGKGHLLLPEAALGFCAAKKQTYYGFRLLAVTTLDGIIVDWNLFAANTDEREAAQELLENYRNLSVLGDKGFLDQKRQSILSVHLISASYQCVLSVRLISASYRKIRDCSC